MLCDCEKLYCVDKAKKTSFKALSQYTFYICVCASIKSVTLSSGGSRIFPGGLRQLPN